MSGIQPKNLAEINDLLNPYIFQVVGSTPGSIRDALKKSTLAGNPRDAVKLAGLCIFAAAVNKSTMESFLANPKVAEVRPTINASFAIQGKPNMTALTLLGHCLLTTPLGNAVTFGAEYRKKMGQDHIWAGDLKSGSISDKQREILSEKKRVTNESEAKLLGSAFIKWSGITQEPMSADEVRFWNGSIARDAAVTGASGGSASDEDVEEEEVTLNDGSTVSVPVDILEWYKKFVSDDDENLVTSIAKRGVAAWIRRYGEAMRRDPEGVNIRGQTVV